MNLSFCDSDNDGFLAFDLIEILDQVQLSVASDLDDNDPRVLIGTSEGTFLEVGDILQNPTVTSLCDLVPASFDVAINSNSEIFTTNEDSIEQVNTGACTTSAIAAFGGNSMSFDTQNNLYFNYLSQNQSSVYRWDEGFTGSPYVWHNFGQGRPGGDFVILGNYMYIAWKNIDNTDSLFKVQLDSDFNYVSHEVLGELKFDTFGLASEQGVLYGVTASEIYRIVLDTSTPTFETVLSNDFSYGAWFGAAGFSEAIEITSSAHISETDAQNNSNALSNPWTNTVEDSQTIYVRTENITTGNFIVTPVNIEIYSLFENNPPDLSSCDTDNDGIVSFDFTSQSTLIMGTQDTSLYEVIFYNDIDLSSSISNPSNYQTIEPLETIFFRIINTDNEECFSEGSFNITIAGPDSCNENDPPGNFG